MGLQGTAHWDAGGWLTEIRQRKGGKPKNRANQET